MGTTFTCLSFSLSACLSVWPRLFKGWITLSTGNISIQWISIDKTIHAIHWIVIYPVDSVIQPLDNWDLSVCLPVYPSVCLSICLSLCLSACLSHCVPVCLCLSVCLSARFPVCFSICLSVYLPNWLILSKAKVKGNSKIGLISLIFGQV